MSSVVRAEQQRWLTGARWASFLLSSAIASCGSRSGIDSLTSGELDTPVAIGARIPDDTAPPPEAELALPSPSLDTQAGCVAITHRYTSSPPTVLLLIDQSASMRESFGSGSTRWDVLREAIVDRDDGLLTWLDASANIGLITYTSLDGFERGRECPITQRQAVRLGNADLIREFYASVEPFPQGDTPTADAIDVAVSALASSGAGPARYVLLLTDGNPDTCAEPDPQNGLDDAVDAVIRAREQGIIVKTVGVSPEVERDSLQQMSNAAAGKPLELDYPDDPDAETPLYASTDPRQLASQLKGVIGDVRSCDIELGADIDPRRARQGRLRLDGRELEYRSADGWTLATSHSIELHGRACDSVLGSGEELQIEFPCEAASEPRPR
ncbi:MAG TPA: vWA domain-containing protein [Polyangiaceae bacterium]|nr:vWA domain-containing protein [Polyangiaceae bacterium]